MIQRCCHRCKDEWQNGRCKFCCVWLLLSSAHGLGEGIIISCVDDMFQDIHALPRKIVGSFADDPNKIQSPAVPVYAGVSRLGCVLAMWSLVSRDQFPVMIFSQLQQQHRHGIPSWQSRRCNHCWGILGPDVLKQQKALFDVAHKGLSHFICWLNALPKFANCGAVPTGFASHGTKS